MEERKLQRLFDYCSQEWPIFPVHWVTEKGCSCGLISCKSPGKHPLVENGFRAAITDPGQVQVWHARWPQANWGLRTGDRATGGAGLLVVDIDKKSNGFETWDLLRNEHLEPIETVTVSTGGGGQHLWFIYPEGVNIRSRAGALGPGIDIRANDGYVLVPPSQTAAPYTFFLNPDEFALDACPGWVLEMLQAKTRPQVRRLPAGVRIGHEVPQGDRHQALITMAGAMRRVGMKTDEMQAVLEVIRDQRFAEGDHPVTDSEIIDAVQWVSQKKRAFMLTDLGNAERFIELFVDRVKYCYQWEQWLVWDGRRWEVNAEAEAVKLAHATVRSIYFEASFETDEEKRKAVTRHAIASEARQKISSMLECAKPYLAVQVEQLDQQPMMLNLTNGVLDLAAGFLLPHNPAYLLTKLTDIVYDPAAECPEWEKFLDLVTGGDKELQSFLQCAVGYTLTGRTDEHCLFLLYGTGKNGKTTFSEAIRSLVGDYALRMDIEALMQAKGQGQAATPYIAQMKGERFVLASEVPENRKLNESLVKDLTGGDSVTARFLFSNPFVFNPTHKLWMFGNNKPTISGTDEGIWRRIRVIPFTVTIPEERRKPLSEVLAVFASERSGILNWAITGSQIWQAQGLPIVEAVRAATAEYRTDQDLVQQFLEEECDMHSEFVVEKDALYKAWREWCESAGEKDAVKRPKSWLTHQMTVRGYQHGGAGRSALVGIRLKK